jgi:hypothetical protein
MNQPYGNVCGINSNKIKFYGLCENIEVFLTDFSHIILLMNILVIDVSDAWEILLLRSWYAALGVFVRMDLTHAHIPMGYDTFEILYSLEWVNKHVITQVKVILMRF